MQLSVLILINGQRAELDIKDRFYCPGSRLMVRAKAGASFRAQQHKADRITSQRMLVQSPFALIVQLLCPQTRSRSPTS